MEPNLHPLCDIVQYNCNIADARHASNYTLCVYLLKMREYYRWEKGYSYRDQLPREAVGNWVAARENLWESLEQSKYLPIEIDQHQIDPFDTERINELLVPRGFVYSGGLGLRCAPHFFLGRLAQSQSLDGFTLLISSDECARDLTAPPAMTLGKTIFVRMESLRRLLWERIQEWQWNHKEGAMARALSFYPIDEDLDEALDKITEAELQMVIAHEIGEARATQQLGDHWRGMLADMPRSKTEMMVRAVKDLYADAISTLPKIIDTQSMASLHFHAASLTAMRKELYPRFLTTYQTFVETQDWQVLLSLVEQSQTHWQALAQDVLDLYLADESEKIEGLIHARHL